MKKLLQSSIIALLAGILISSCSVQKRQYMPGYDISWKHHHQKVVKHDAVSKASSDTNAVTSAAPVPAETHPVAASNEGVKETSVLSSPTPVKRRQHTEPAIPAEKNPGTARAAAKGHPANDMVRSVVRQIGQLAMSGDGDRVNGFAVASLVLGIVSLVAYYGAFVLGVLAIVFGAIALSHIRRDGGRGRLMALAGLICGIVALAIIITIVMVAAAP